MYHIVQIIIYSFITNPDFISAHIKNNTTPQFFLRYFDEKTHQQKHLFEPDDDSFSGFHGEADVLPLCNHREWVNFLGCVNGVIGLVDDVFDEGTSFVLCNPSIRKFVELPQPHHVYQTFGPYESASGFGFDLLSNDYKVVRVVRNVGWLDEPSKVEVELFSLRLGCWRKLSVRPSYHIHRRGGGGGSYKACFLDGAVHWVGINRGEQGGYAIVKFDLSTESFGVIEGPSCLKDLGSGFTPLHVQDCGGKLALIKDNKYDMTCIVWVMKDYGVLDSWTKILHLNVGNWCPREMPRAFGFRKNGEVIMVKGGRGPDVIVSIDPSHSTQHGEKMLGEISGEPYSFYMCTYIESLALFSEGEGIGVLSSKKK